jgi:hypothetical protein
MMRPYCMYFQAKVSYPLAILAQTPTSSIYVRSNVRRSSQIIVVVVFVVINSDDKPHSSTRLPGQVSNQQCMQGAYLGRNSWSWV